MIEIKKMNMMKHFIFFFAFSFVVVSVQAQKMNIKGKVVNENNEPLIGASVSVQGKNGGTVTNKNGAFSIKASTDDFLVVSYLGYSPKTVELKGQNNLIVRLQPATSSLNQLVVVGYGTQEKKDVTGSISSLDGQKVADYRTSSVLGAIQGQVPGVHITKTDGQPGSGYNVKIRGVGTLTGDASPLLIVDGFEVSSLDFLSNSDIKDIQILKDASASAIYGARAANGVILITTKEGTIGRPKVNLSVANTYRSMSKRIDVLNPYEFVKLQTDINSKYAKTYYRTGIDSMTMEPFKYQSLEDYKGVKGIDWQDETFRPTWSQDYNLSMNGGTDETKYYMSLHRYFEDGMFLNSSYKRVNAALRVNQKLTKSLKMDARIHYANVDNNGAGTQEGNGRFNMLAGILGARPTGGLKIDDSTLLAAPIDPLILETSGSIANVNPVKQTQSVTNNKKTEAWNANLAFNWNIGKGFRFRTAGSYRMAEIRRDVFFNDGSKQAYRNGQSPYGRSQIGKKVSWTNSNTLRWHQRKNRQTVDIMVGQETNFRSQQYVRGEAMDFPFDNLGVNNLGIGATPSEVTSSYTQKRLISFFARANYSYRNKYLLTATMRADGSSVFSQNNKWGYFPSFSLAWRLSEEDFIKDIGSVSNFKLRFGWGIVGNDRIPGNLSLDLYAPTKYGIGGASHTVLNIKDLKNEALRWEGASTLNLGIDFGMFDQRLTLTADFYIKNTKDLLLAESLARVTGFTSQIQNIGKIRNKGIELTIKGTPIETRRFTWDASFNISFLHNRLVALQPGLSSMFVNSGFSGNFTENDYVAYIGMPIGLMYGYVFDGVYQYDDFKTTPKGDQILKDGVPENTLLNTIEPGKSKFKDINGDGKITTDDRTVIGHGYPKWYGGFSNTFTYKGFDLNFLINFNYGNDIYNATRLFTTQTRRPRFNQQIEVVDRWKPTHASNRVPSALGYVQNVITSRFIEDGSFLRFKKVSLGYTLPKALTQHIYISDARVFINAQNLFVLSGYSGFDPEVSTHAGNPMTPGLDWGAYPRSRMFVFGLDLKF